MLHSIHIHTSRSETSRSNVNIEAVRKSVGDNPESSNRRRGLELQISRSSTTAYTD